MLLTNRKYEFVPLSKRKETRWATPTSPKTILDITLRISSACWRILHSTPARTLRKSMIREPRRCSRRRQKCWADFERHTTISRKRTRPPGAQEKRNEQDSGGQDR